MKPSRKLVAAVGQPWMRDLAFGSHVVEHLLSRGGLPPAVDAIDMSFGPITAFQMIQDGAYGQIVFVTARASGRARGTIYESAVELPAITPAELQLRIGDCVMGCISLESLLYLCRRYETLPNDSAIVDIEPEDDTWGPELSDSVAPLVEPAARLALQRLGVR